MRRRDLPRGLKNPPANAGDSGDVGSIPGWGRSPGEGHGNPLQYSCLENPMNRGAWRAAFHGVSKCVMRLSTHTHTKGLIRTYRVCFVCGGWVVSMVAVKIHFPKSHRFAKNVFSWLNVQPYKIFTFI